MNSQSTINKPCEISINLQNVIPSANCGPLGTLIHQWMGLDERLYLSTNPPPVATSTCRVTVDAQDSLHLWHCDIRELRKGMGYAQDETRLHW